MKRVVNSKSNCVSDDNEQLNLSLNDHKRKTNIINNSNEKIAPVTRNKIIISIENLLWLSASGLTLYYTDIINALKVDSRINNTAFTWSIVSTCIPLLIFSYLIVWCSWIKGIHSDSWEVYSPYSIPVATLSGVVSSICWIVTLYGVYGYKTPLILFILFMGFVTLIALMPPWTPEPEQSRTSVTKIHKNE